MCGIFCAFCRNSEESSNDVLRFLSDFCKESLKRRGPDQCNFIEFDEGSYKFHLGASVLWLQGQGIIEQPFESVTSKFVYNGDVFGGKAIDSYERKTKGDTKLFLEVLDNSKNVSVTLSEIHGPYAFIYLNTARKKLYFGRDIFGRRSLLIGKKFDITVLCSVTAKHEENCNFIELPAIGTFCYNLENATLEIMPWRYKNKNFTVKLQELEQFLKMPITVNQEIEIVEKIIFRAPQENELKIYGNLKNLDFDTAMLQLLSHKPFSDKVCHLEKLLEKAVYERISTQPKFCHNCIKTFQDCNHPLTGVLFSGGLDCSILALLADKFSDKNRPIDLFNVAFDRCKDYKTPDRLTGLETYEELCKIRPGRKWKFVEINVTENELNAMRSNHIRHLIYPLNTILDDSLGSALWFASRGSKVDYISPCRVLLVGMGADELFGGYTRHRNALKRIGWEGLHESLDEDWQNISHRNLARDDRVVSDHGKQLRTPYLDEIFVEYVRKLNSWEKTCPRDDLPQGFGEKILLRGLAYHLGLKKASSFKKRALQFGSRIANSKENAQDVSPRL